MFRDTIIVKEGVFQKKKKNLKKWNLFLKLNPIKNLKWEMAESKATPVKEKREAHSLSS